MLNRNNDVYFASHPPYSRDFLDACKDKINTWRDYCKQTGQAARWELALGANYGSSPDGKNSWRVTPGGEFGELVQFKVNEYASLIKHELVLAIQQRPAGIAKAINTDIKTLRDARVGTQLVEYYLSDPAHDFEADYVQTLYLALLTSEAFLVQDWDPSKGGDIRPETDEQGQPTSRMAKEGDLIQEVFGIWNSATDIGAPKADQPWRIFSGRVNKFELAAKYPAYKDAILLNSDYGTGASGITKPLLYQMPHDGTDFIEIHKVIHLPTDACGAGRYSLLIADEVILDVDYPYIDQSGLVTKNFHRCSEMDMFETPFAHTSNYDLLSLEQVTDSLHSVILNNQTTFGVATIVGPKGGGIAQQELAKGLRYLELDPNLVDKIRPLELLSTPAEIFNYIGMLSQKKGEFSGINSILRGDPEGQLKGASGSAMALLQSQAISYNSGVQRAFYKLLSRGGTGTIEINRIYAHEPRVKRIAGKQNAQAVKEFKFDAKTLGAVSTILFEPVNPVLQTASGKLTVAQDLLQAGMLASPRRYIEVLTTGNLNVLIEDDVACEEAIIEENEQLSEGKPIQAVITENHQQHIMGHQAVICQPNAKQDPQLIQNVLGHIQEHVNLWQMLSANNPALLAATGQQVLPQMAPPPGGPPTGNPSGGPGLPPGQPANAQNENQPQLPKPPVDPGTGQRAPVAPGTSIQGV
jgi:hypothetical protein